jgi:hypothetical protein
MSFTRDASSPSAAVSNSCNPGSGSRRVHRGPSEPMNTCPEHVSRGNGTHSSSAAGPMATSVKNGEGHVNTFLRVQLPGVDSNVPGGHSTHTALTAMRPGGQGMQ